MIQFYGQTISLSEKAFKFYGDAVIDRETLKKDTTLLRLELEQKDTALINRNEKVKDLEQENKINELKSNNYKNDLSNCGEKLNKKSKWNKIFIKAILTSISVAILEGIIIYLEIIKK